MKISHLFESFTTKGWLTAEDIKPETDSDDVPALKDWMNAEIKDLRFRRGKWPMSVFREQAKNYQTSWSADSNDRKRTDACKAAIEKSGERFPVFVADGDTTNFVMEGRHRLLASYEMGDKTVPVFFVKKVEQQVE